MVKVGIIGYGYTGQQHARAFESLAGVDLRAVSETDPQKRALVAVQAYEDYRYLLDDYSLEAVSICLPHNLHEQVATEALNAGKNVLVEKPLAASVEAGERLCQLARKVSRVLMVEMTHRFMPPVVEARQLILKRELGDVIAVTDAIVECVGSLPGWLFCKQSAGGGVGLSSGIHLLDQVAWITGQSLTLDSARFGHSFAMGDMGDIEDTASFFLHLNQGAPVHILLCWRPRGKDLESELSIYGSKGTLYVDVWRGWRLVTEVGCRGEVHFDETLSIAERALEGMKGALAEFIAAVRENREPFLKPEESLTSQSIIEQAYRLWEIQLKGAIRPTPTVGSQQEMTQPKPL